MRHQPSDLLTFIYDYVVGVLLGWDLASIVLEIYRPLLVETQALVNETFRAGGVDDYEPIVQTTGAIQHP